MDSHSSILPVVVSTPSSPSSSRPLPPTIKTHSLELSDSTSKHQSPTINVSTHGIPLVPLTPTIAGTVRDSDSHITPHNDPTNPFAFEATQLTKLVDPKSIELLNSIGGVNGLLRGLHSRPAFGLSSDEHAQFTNVRLNDILADEDTDWDDAAKTKDGDQEELRGVERVGTRATISSEKKPALTFPQRSRVFGINTLPEVKPKSIFTLMWQAMQDKILILLTIAAFVSLGVGLYEDFGIAHDKIENKDGTFSDAPKIKWVEGVAIIVAITVVVMVGSLNDYQKEKQFRKLNQKKEDRAVKASYPNPASAGTRSGVQLLIPIHEVQVGDILHLEPGDVVAADGVFIEGHNLKCDESGATGESDAVKKLDWNECYKMYQLHKHDNFQDDDARSVSATSGISTPLSPITPVDGHRRTESAGQLLSSHDNQFLAPPLPVSPTAVGAHRSGGRGIPAGIHLPDPFIISGSKVLEGVGSYVVTAVGVNSFNGKTMMSLRHEAEETPLQVKLNDLAEKIAKLGGAAALLMLIVLLIKYFVGWKTKNAIPAATSIVQDLLVVIISTITVVVVAVPEGLPLAVTLALAYATQRMLKDNNLVRVLSACETMGNATTVCSDKTGTLTENKMTVVAGTFGTSFRFLNDPPAGRSDLISIGSIHDRMTKPLFEIVSQAIAVNSSAFETKDENGQATFVGSKTETALLTFLRNIGGENHDELRKRFSVRQLYPFSSDRKAMATVIKMPILDKSGNKVKTVYRAHVKGASEVLVKNCGFVVMSRSDEYADADSAVKSRRMTQEIENRMNKIIQSYATRSLRTIALCYRDFDTWPPPRPAKPKPNGGPSDDSKRDVKFQNSADIDINVQDSDEEFEVEYSELIADHGLTLIGIVGIEDPLREGVKEAVRQCQEAGVFVRMVTGDNVLTAKSIAKQCGIYTNGGVVMEGPEFLKLSPEAMDEVIPRLQVLARSSPEDKRILVRRLKELGETVAVTGDGTNDGPALKMADVGFSMGITGTEVAKEASSIILMDDNFSSIVKAIMWGRSVNDSVKKFLQFQLTVNVTAVLLTFITAVSNPNQQSVLTAVQLLWVNLIMDTFAALALATDPPTPELLKRDPEPKSAPLITFQMWKMILGQSIFQLVVTLILYYGGDSILGYNTTERSISLQTVVFNTFVFMQIFNELNSRVIDNQLNVFKGVTKNLFFVVITAVMIAGQIVIVEFGGPAFQTTPLDVIQWVISVSLGVISLPVGLIIRLIPDDTFGFLIRNRQTRERYLQPNHRRSTLMAPSMYLAGNERMAWQSAYTHVRSQLSVFKSLRGGRQSSDQKNLQEAFAAAAVGTGMVASSVGVGWLPLKGDATPQSGSNFLAKTDTADRRDSLELLP